MISVLAIAGLSVVFRILITTLCVYAFTNRRRDSETSYSDIIEASPHGVLIHRNFKPLYANQKFVEIFGYKNTKEILAIDSALVTLTSADDHPRIKAINAKRMDDKDEIARLEINGIHKSGRILWLEIESRLITWKGEAAVLGFVTDISQRRLAELALQESERHFRTVFNQQFLYMAILDVNGIILSINDLPLKIQRVSRDEMIGKHYWLTPGWKDSPEWQEIIRSRIEQCKTMNVPLEVEDNYMTPDGEVRIAKASYLALFDDQGKPELILVQANDITEQSLTERNLLEMRQREHLVLQSASMGTWEWDIVVDKVTWSPETCQIFGTDQKNFGGTLEGYMEFTDPADIEHLEVTITDFLGTASPSQDVLQYQHRIIRKDFSRGWVEIFGRLFFDDEQKPLRMVGICIDISKRKKEEELLEQKNMELERFTYTVSHELKTPLVTINGFLGLLSKDLASADHEKVQRNIGFITRAVETMGQQLEDLLELSRIGRVVSPPKDFSLGKACQQVVKAMAGVIDKSGARISIADDLPFVYADPSRIQEVMQNLIENAIKFSVESGTPEISISAERRGQMVLCRVQDNGPGINPDYHDRVFNLFDRLESGVSGTGIGLAVAKRIIEVHGGDIWVESLGDGKGASFIFSLPAAGGTAESDDDGSPAS